MVHRRNVCATVLYGALTVVFAASAAAQIAPAPTDPSPTMQTLPSAPDQHLPGTLHGTITDTDQAAIPGAKLVLEDPATKVELTTGSTEADGEFTFANLPPGRYRIKVTAHGFSSWKIEDIDLASAEDKTLTPVELGVESIDTSVNAIFSEDLAE